MPGVHAVIVNRHPLQFPARCHYGTGAAEIGRQPHKYDLVGIDDDPAGQIHSLGRACGNENVIQAALDPVIRGGHPRQFLPQLSQTFGRTILQYDIGMLPKLFVGYSKDVIGRKNRGIRPAAGQRSHARGIHQFIDFPDSRRYGATGTF